MFRRNIISIFLALLVIITILNILYIRTIQHKTRSYQKIKSHKNNNTFKKSLHLNYHNFKNELLYVQLIQEEIKNSINTLPSRYFNRNSQYKYVLQNIINQLNIDQNLSSSIIDKLRNVSIIYFL